MTKCKNLHTASSDWRELTISVSVLVMAIGLVIASFNNGCSSQPLLGAVCNDETEKWMYTGFGMVILALSIASFAVISLVAKDIFTTCRVAMGKLMVFFNKH